MSYVNNRRHILDRHSGVTLVVNQCFKNITIILLFFEPLLLCVLALGRVTPALLLDGILFLKFFHTLTDSRISSSLRALLEYHDFKTHNALTVH